MYPELAKIAPTIDVTVDQANFVASFKHSVINLATIFSKENDSETKLASLDASITGVKEKTAAHA